MTQNFDSFIEKLGRETVAAINKGKKTTTENKTEIKREVSKTLPIAPQMIVEEQEEPEEQSTAINEDFVEKALDYAKIIVKSVRSTFKTEEERKKVFEAIHGAVGLFLEHKKSIPQVSSPLFPGSKVGSGTYNDPGNSNLTLHGTMTEEEWNKMPLVQSEAAPDVPLEIQSKATGYKRDMKIVLKESADGKKEVDLSQVSAQDIDDIKVLAGIK
jgi:hypothetical protein